jgi:hypothetical protein
MAFMRRPPEITERSHPERPMRPPPDKIGTWSFLAQTQSGRLRLVEKQSGIEVFWRQDPGTPLRGGWHMRCLCELYRSLAAVCQGQEGVYYEEYHPLPTDDDPTEFYICTLPPGIYVITPGAEPEGQLIWWYDPSWLDEVQEMRQRYWPTRDQTNAAPQLPPEVLAKLRSAPIKPTVKRLHLRDKKVITKAKLR